MGIRHCANTVTKTSSKVRKGVGIRREGMLQLFARAVTKDTKGGVRKKGQSKLSLSVSTQPATRKRHITVSIVGEQDHSGSTV